MRLSRWLPAALLVGLAAAPTLAEAQLLPSPDPVPLTFIQPGVTPGAYFVLPPDPHAASELELEGAYERTRWEAIVPGLVALVGGYVGYLLTTIVWNSVNNECRHGFLTVRCEFNGRGPEGSDIERSLVPLVGPWISVADSPSMRGADLAVPIASGLAQAAGLITLIVGIAAPVTASDSDMAVNVGPGSAEVRLRFD